MTTSSSIEHVVTHLIAGPLGSGKTSLLRGLLSQRPQHERWAILINEFGQVGIDAALLQKDAAGVELAEIPGGCLCCVNGVPFQVGLGRLLRRARPHRLFIEASGLGHPQALLRQLAADPWQNVLALQPLIMVLDAPRLLTDGNLSEPQQQALEVAGLAVLNKTEELTSEQCADLTLKVHPLRSVCTVQGVLDLSQLPVSATPSRPASDPQLAEVALPAGQLWRGLDDWHCHSHQEAGQNSIGWIIHPHQTFHLDGVRSWLDRFPWDRAKGVMHTPDGWMSFNAVAGEKPMWQTSDWRRDNRLEVISSKPFDFQELESALRATVVTPPILNQSELR